MSGGSSRRFRHWVDSFVQGSLASQPHPVIICACAHTEYDYVYTVPCVKLSIAIRLLKFQRGLCTFTDISLTSAFNCDFDSFSMCQQYILTPLAHNAKHSPSYYN